MDALVGVNNPTEVFFQPANLQTQPKNEIQSASNNDTVEISQEAVNALKTDAAIKRATSLMQKRGLSKEEIAEFRSILEQFKTSSKSPKDFLKALSVKERDLVKRANSYGRDLSDREIDSWSKEGAVNMLREQDWRFAVDSNNDNIVQHGAAKTFSFPPPNSPEIIKDAWEIMSKDMSFKEQMLFTFRFAPIKIEGYPEATTIRGYNINKQGLPKSADGWIDLLDKIYETSEYNLKLQNTPEVKANTEKLMENIRKFQSIIKDLKSK